MWRSAHDWSYWSYLRNEITLQDYSGGVTANDEALFSKQSLVTQVIKSAMVVIKALQLVALQVLLV
jgi:hypothetical protein